MSKSVSKSSMKEGGKQSYTVVIYSNFDTNKCGDNFATSAI